jgi:hypothetical protein
LQTLLPPENENAITHIGAMAIAIPPNFGKHQPVDIEHPFTGIHPRRGR